MPQLSNGEQDALLLATYNAELMASAKIYHHHHLAPSPRKSLAFHEAANCLHPSKQSLHTLPSALPPLCRERSRDSDLSMATRQKPTAPDEVLRPVRVAKRGYWNI